MRPHGPTFWLLDGTNGWCTSSAEDSSDSTSGIRLAAAPGGPLSFNGGDGSLGGLVLPSEIAIDERNQIYLLVQATVKRFNARDRYFKELPGIGGSDDESSQQSFPSAIAVAAGALYLADPGNRRVQVLDLETLTLSHVWSPLEMGGEVDGILNPNSWEPVDLAATDDIVYILDRKHGRVYCHRSGTDHPVLLFESSDSVNRWSRIALDRQGLVYLFNANQAQLDVYNTNGRQLATVHKPGAVRDRFQPPILRVDHRGRFCIPADLANLCGGQVDAPPVENPLARCLPPAKDALLFDKDGNPSSFDPAERPGPRPYHTEGEWISKPLNSQLRRCQWHRIELELADLPAGSRVEVCTYCEDNEEAIPGCCHEEEGCSTEESKQTSIADHLWKTSFITTGPMQAPQNLGPVPSKHEFLIQSREGQYLRVRLKLAGDGYATPVVSAIRVHYPRQSYLDYLPAVFSEDDNSRRFLERFLSIFQTELEQYENFLADMPGLFDPEAVPAGPFLTWLASLVGLPLENEWNWEQKRRLLVAVPELYRNRGTCGGLRSFLQVYLANITGLGTEQVALSGFPRIVEAFRERQHMMLAFKHTSLLTHGAPLWGLGQVGRLQTDVYAREGEVKLVSVGDPQRDWFQQHAHRFRVFVPAAWIRNAKDERMLQRALDAEKPAHTQYQLCLISPSFQIGISSSVGLNTIIGDYPETRLGCATDTASKNYAETGTPPASLPPVNRLGIDTVLGSMNNKPLRLRLGPGRRLRTNNRLN